MNAAKNGLRMAVTLYITLFWVFCVFVIRLGKTCEIYLFGTGLFH